MAIDAADAEGAHAGAAHAEVGPAAGDRAARRAHSSTADIRIRSLFHSMHDYNDCP